VQVRHDEGVATRIDRQPCVVIREDGGEAVGECMGQPLSRESRIPGTARFQVKLSPCWPTAM